MRHTKTQVIEQEKRFNKLIEKVNLLKLGKIIIGNNDMEYKYKFIHRYLRLNNINGNMYKHNTTSFYYEILLRRTFNILFDNETLKKDLLK